MKKVLEVTGEPILRGGQETFIINCICNIKNEDMHIDMLTLYYCENEYYRSIVENRGGETYELHLPFEPGKSRKNLVKPLSDFLSKNSYDVVHVHSGSISVLAYVAKAAKKANVNKIIVHSHSTGINNLKHKLVQLAFSHMLKVNPTDYCACSKEAGLMKFPKDIAENHLLVLKNGIDIQKFFFNPLKRTELRKMYNIDADEIVIGHVGRFVFEKNHRFMLDMFSQLTNKLEKSKLIFIGDGELKNEIEIKSKAMGLEDKIIFVGSVDDIWNYYSMLDVFILPSLYEGFSLVTLEAQAAGLPCVVSTGVPEDVKLCDHVERVDLNDINTWIDEVIKESKVGRLDNYKTLKDSGYDIKETVNELVDLYDKK